MKIKNLAWLSLFLLFITGCGEKKYSGTCTVSGAINNYKRMGLALYEITPSKNYLVSKIEIGKNGKFEAKFSAAEKSVYGITNGRDFIYFINDVPDISIETSQNEFDNYIVQDSPGSEQLRQLVATHKKLSTEVTLAERMLISKMAKYSGKFGNDPQMLDLENKADKRALELRTFVTHYMDTVSDKLFAVAASSFLSFNEDFNYLDNFYKKVANTDVKKLQINDLKIELDKIRRSFQSIAPLTQWKGIGRDGKPKLIDDLAGKYVFVNVWASWCYLSRTQVPFIKQAYQKFGSNDRIEFINVSIDEKLSDWNTFLTKEQYELKNNLCDTFGKGAAILKRFGLDYIPANFLLDQKGNIMTSNLKDDNLVLTIESVLGGRAK